MRKWMVVFCTLISGILIGETIVYSPGKDAADCETILASHNPDETNEVVRARQKSAIHTLARVGTTNCITLLSQIWRTEGDYAGRDACDAALMVAARLKLADELIAIASEVSTNGTPYKVVSGGDCEVLCRKHLYRTLLAIYAGRMRNGGGECSSEVQDAVRTFLYDRTGKEHGAAGIYLDLKLAATIPSYRHSQFRRDNLARLQNEIAEENLLRIVRNSQQDADQTK